MLIFRSLKSARLALLATTMACLCSIAQADLAIEGLAIQPGLKVAEVQKSLNTTQMPEDMVPVNPGRLNQTQLRLKDNGIWVFFDRHGVSQTIRLDAPFAGSVGGIKIGSSHADVLNILGKPVLELNDLPVKPAGPVPVMYDINTYTRVRLDFNANQAVVTMYIVRATLTPTAPAKTITSVTATTAPATPATPATPANNDMKAMLDSQAWQAYAGVSSDLLPLYRHDADLKLTLSQLDSFEFSDDTKKKLRDLTGNDHPLHFKTTRLRDGNIELATTVDALDFKDAKTGVNGHMAEITGKTSFNKNLTKTHTTASLPLFHLETAKALQFTAGNFSMASDRQRGPYGLWLGTGEVKLGQLTMDDGASKIHMTMDDLAVKTAIKARGQSVDVSYDGSIKSLDWVGDGLTQIHLAARVTNLNAKDFAAVVEKTKAMNQKGQSVEERLLASKALVKDFGKSMEHGGAIEIQDVSAKFHGKSGGFDGRIALDNAQDGDFDSIATLIKKLDIRINFHVPVGWWVDGYRMSMRKVMEAQNKTGKPVDEAAVSVAANTETQKQIAEWEKKKWIRVERDTILSTIEFKGGQLFVNGQPVALPPPVAPVPAAPVKPPPANATPAAGDTSRPADKVLAAGETFVLTKGQIVNFPAPATISTPDGSRVKIVGNKNKVNAGPGAKVEVAASATGPADNVAVVAGTEVIQAAFGTFNPPGSGKPAFVPAGLVPLMPNQAYGWQMQLHSDKTAVKWKEELTLPAKPATWGPPGSAAALRISADGRTAAAEKTVVPDHGAISSRWLLESGDPAGHYVMRVMVEDAPVQVFEFDVR